MCFRNGITTKPTSMPNINKEIFAFDFDGTVTDADTLIGLVKHIYGTGGLLRGLLMFAPVLVLMKLHLYSNHRTKQMLFSHYFCGMTLNEFNARCRSYAQSSMHIMRPAAIAAMAEAQKRGAQVVVVSASMPNWVAEFIRMAAASPGNNLKDNITVIGTEPQTDGGVLTGRFATPNCYGREKAQRLLALFPDRGSYRLEAFGDSRGDRQLLAMADKAHYKPFRQ